MSESPAARRRLRCSRGCNGLSPSRALKNHPSWRKAPTCPPPGSPRRRGRGLRVALSPADSPGGLRRSGSRHGPHENRLPPEHATRHPSFNTHPRDPPSPDVLCDFQREAIVWADVYSNIHVAPRGTLGCPCGVHVLRVNPPSTHPAGAVPGFGAGRTGPVGALFIVPFGLGTCSCSDQ